MTDPLGPLRRFVKDMTTLVDEAREEALLISTGTDLLAGLVAQDGWLPDDFAKEASGRYAQYLLHCDPFERFSVVSFVWGKGQITPVHDHTVWGLVGVLRGAERCEEFALKDGRVEDLGVSHVMRGGQVDAVSPTIGDWHRVGNASDGVSVSIHVYGANIGTTRRHRLDENAEIVDFISGYDNATVPNLWSRI